MTNNIANKPTFYGKPKPVGEYKLKPQDAQEYELFVENTNIYSTDLFEMNYKEFKKLQDSGRIKLKLLDLGVADLLYILFDENPIGFLGIASNKRVRLFNPILSQRDGLEKIKIIAKLMKYDPKKDEREWLREENLENHKQITYDDMNVEIDPFDFYQAWLKEKFKIDVDDLGYPKKTITLDFIFNFDVKTDEKKKKIIISPRNKSKNIEELFAKTIIKTFIS